MNATIIEDVLGVGGVSQPINMTHTSPDHPAYGLQMPQPLKPTNNYHANYSNTSTTIPSWDVHASSGVSTGQPTNIIRDRVPSSQAYQQAYAGNVQQQGSNPNANLLKQNTGLNTDYAASSNTLPMFNSFSGNNILTGAAQSSAIRGKVTSPHVYNWDMTASQEPEKPKDYGMYSGMKTSHLQQQEANAWQSLSLDPKQAIREAIATLYANATMLKTHQFGNFSVYKCPVDNLTGGNYKFIVAIVPNHQYVQLGAYHSLRSLPWVSFQTRVTDNPNAELGPNRPNPITYQIPNTTSNPLFDKINMILEQPDRFVYVAETLPCKVELLRNKEHSTAAPKSTIISALESFRSIIVLHE